MAHKLQDKGRRLTNLWNRSVRDVLPEYFVSEYPDLVTFLEKYYDYLDSADNFGDKIHDIFSLRDISETDTANLNNIISEIGTGLQNGELFLDPRYAAKRFAEHYRRKGSRFSIEDFFRTMYQEEVEVEYPKKDLFIVGESEIGYDGQKYIQNYARYQILSLLIKSGLSTSTWRELYKRFVHPAGWYFEGVVQLETEVDINMDSAFIPIADSAVLSLVSEASPSISLISEITGLSDSDGTNVRYTLDEIISVYQTLTAEQIDGYYANIREVITPNSFKFDDSDTDNTPLISLTTETMDNNMFTRYTSDSSY